MCHCQEQEEPEEEEPGAQPVTLVMLCLHLEARPAQIEGEQKRSIAGDMRQNTFPFLGLQTPLLQQLGFNKAE